MGSAEIVSTKSGTFMTWMLIYFDGSLPYGLGFVGFPFCRQVLG